jgi:hypothetical protein
MRWRIRRVHRKKKKSSVGSRGEVISNDTAGAVDTVPSIVEDCTELFELPLDVVSEQSIERQDDFNTAQDSPLRPRSSGHEFD